MKNKKIENMTRKEIEALSVEELKDGMRSVFREAEKKRRWQEIDNSVKKIMALNLSLSKKMSFHLYSTIFLVLG